MQEIPLSASAHLKNMTAEQQKYFDAGSELTLDPNEYQRALQLAKTMNAALGDFSESNVVIASAYGIAAGFALRQCVTDIRDVSPIGASVAPAMFASSLVKMCLMEGNIPPKA